MESSSALAHLNDAQREAVLAVQGPVLVLAGAGTGKTRVLTTRIAHILLNKYAFPGEILAVTFTNKAAREMSERVRQLTGESQAMWLGTFHSICARMLRRHAEMLGLTSSFTILDEDDQIRLVKAILQEKNIDEKSMPAKLVLAVLQGFKDQGLVPEKITHSNDRNKLGGQAQEIYAAYQARLKALNAVDFGDLILHTLTLFSEHQEVLRQYSERFKYILVDEYQDTNAAQYMWLRLLALAHQNICCVGDDDQSIYSWRGAEVGNILKFEHDFPNAKVVRLECNYRSTKHILGAASSLIANNRGRLGKTLYTPHEGEAEKVRVKAVWDDREEAQYVAEEIEVLQRGKEPLNEMAILVRAGFQTRSFEERFLTQGIPYRVIGGLRFYERQEIKDAIAYLRVVFSPSDDLAFERIVNVPKRGIGQATLQQIHSASREKGVPLSVAVEQMQAEGALKGKLGASLKTLMEQFTRWRSALQLLPIAEVMEQIIEESGYREMWKKETSPDAAGRIENLRELIRAMGEFESAEAFLEHVGLVADAANQDADAEQVSLMTLHAAKGLEFNIVFLPGWEEGVFPHQRAMDESGMKGLEEERRLAYVGITRARKRLTITQAKNRRIYNQWQMSAPSRFLKELPEEHIEKLDAPASINWKEKAQSILSEGGADGGDLLPPLRGKGGMGGKNTDNLQYVPPTLTLPLKGGGNLTAGASSQVVKGVRVFHQKFGYGTVRDANGDHLEIDFDKAGNKRVMAGFVEKVA